MRFYVDPRVAWQTVAGEAIILDLVEGKAIGLNAAGTFIWTRLTSQDTDEITVEMARSFSIAPERARSDVDSFVAVLRSRNFVIETK